MTGNEKAAGGEASGQGECVRRGGRLRPQGTLLPVPTSNGLVPPRGRRPPVSPEFRAEMLATLDRLGMERRWGMILTRLGDDLRDVRRVQMTMRVLAEYRPFYPGLHGAVESLGETVTAIECLIDTARVAAGDAVGEGPEAACGGKAEKAEVALADGQGDEEPNDAPR